MIIKLFNIIKVKNCNNINNCLEIKEVPIKLIKFNRKNKFSFSKK